MAKEAFHDGIIMAISFPGHAGDDAVLFGIRLKFLRSIILPWYEWRMIFFTFHPLIACFNIFVANVSVCDSLMTQLIISRLRASMIVDKYKVRSPNKRYVTSVNLDVLNWHSNRWGATIGSAPLIYFFFSTSLTFSSKWDTTRILTKVYAKQILT